MRIQALMNDGGGPSGDPGAGDPGGGSPQPSPQPAPVGSANPRLNFPEPDPGGEPTQKPAAPPPAAGAASAFSYKRGQREFKSQAELDAYMDEVERGRPSDQFDQHKFRDEIFSEIERRYLRGEEDEQPGRGQGQRGTGQEQFAREENPFDKETEPGAWAEHEVKQATASLKHEYDGVIGELREQLGYLSDAHEKSALQTAYKGRFAEAARDPRVARDVEPGMEALLEHVVGIDPRTKNDFSNLPAQVSAWGRRLKSWADQRAAKMGTQLQENGGKPVPSATRGAAAPVTRRPAAVEEPGKLDGQHSTFNRLRKRFQSTGQE